MLDTANSEQKLSFIWRSEKKYEEKARTLINAKAPIHMEEKKRQRKSHTVFMMLVTNVKYQ